MKILSFSRFTKILLGIIVFIIVLLFAAPRVARWYIVRHGKELIGRNISIDKIRFNYFTGTLAVHDLKLFESDGQTTFVSFRNIRVNIDYLPLFRHEIVVKYINLDEPYAEVLQNGNRFNFSDLIKSDTTQTPKDTIPSPPTRYVINNIKISKGYVKYTDQVLNHTIALDSLDLQIPGFTWNSDSTKLDVNFNFVDGGGLYSKLDINQADSTYTINLRLDSLNLGIIEPYLKNYLRISGLNGYLSNNLVIKGSMQSVMKLMIKGKNHVYGFQLKDTLDRIVFSAADMNVDIDTFLLDKNRLRLNHIEILRPFVFFELIDSTNNLSELVKETGTVQTDTSSQNSGNQEAEPGFSYNFPPLVISGGKVLFSDKTLHYPFEYRIDSLSLDCREDKAMPGKLDFKVSAGLNGTGTFSSEGILDPANYSDLDLAFKVGQFRMKDMDSYFKHYFGFPVTGGIMNFNTSNKLRPKSLESNNTIYFRRFTLGQRLQNKVDYKVPLRLAIGILSDKDGIIDLKAPVKMKGDEVKVANLGRIIFRIIGNLFVKAALAPFNLISGLYNSDPASLQEVKLDYEEPSPDIKGLKSVDLITDFLNKKPLISADFIYCLNRQKAADTVAYIIALRNYMKESGKENPGIKTVPDSSLVKYLRPRTKLTQGQTDTSLQALCRAFVGNEKLNFVLDSMARLQTGFLTGYLEKDKGLPPERFKVIVTTPDSIIPSVGYPTFRIYFSAAD